MTNGNSVLSVDNTTTVYAILLSWPEDSVLTLGAPVPSTSTVVTMLGYSEPFEWIAESSQQGINVTIPQKYIIVPHKFEEKKPLSYSDVNIF
jgi:hypothetical protein